MKMTGEYTIAAPRHAVWNALNDPDVLRQCIPGCQSVEQTAQTEYSATVMAKVGPVKAKFSGQVTLSNIDAPNGYRISGEGSGGVAGFARGGADVTLQDAPEGTTLSYAVDAQVGGKLAQIGSRLIDSTAKKMAGDFFRTFGEVVEGAVEDTAEHSASTGEDAMAGDEQVEENVYPGTHWLVWVTAGVALVALVAFVSNF
ncbi:MAG: carbon monoxide dehydrogenase subunit G [Alphaproteobacteria bacterium]|nr:carbon monoxide dehydrogenase subunit G [Alphaproteobacteria bacterium]